MSKTPGKDEVGSDMEITDDKAEADKGTQKRLIPRKLTAKAAEAASAGPAKKTRLGGSSSSDPSSSSSGSSSSSEGKEGPQDKEGKEYKEEEDAMVAQQFAEVEERYRQEQEGFRLAALKKRVAKRVERKMSKVRAASSKAWSLPDVMSSDSDSDTEPATKNDTLLARRLAAEESTQRAATASSIARVAKAEEAARRVAKDTVDREFERRWHDIVARGDPGPAALRDGPKDVPSEQKTGMCKAAHFRSARKRMLTHVDVLTQGLMHAHATQAHASARTWTGTC